MKPYLLDTNVLLALAWPNHVLHHEAVQWFGERGSAAFATCPLTADRIRADLIESVIFLRTRLHRSRDQTAEAVDGAAGAPFLAG